MSKMVTVGFEVYPFFAIDTKKNTTTCCCVDLVANTKKRLRAPSSKHQEIKANGI